MKKLLIASLLLLTTAFTADKYDDDQWIPTWVDNDVSDALESTNSNSFPYISGGIYLPLPLPVIGLGYRIKENNQAFDLSINLATVFVASSVESHIKVLHYFNKQDYFGCGSSFGFSYGGTYFDHAFIGHISPLLTLGREYKDHIKELNLRFPTFTSDGVNWIPALSFKYGWKY